MEIVSNQLDRFRDPKFPFIYWVGQNFNIAIEGVMTGKFGLEIGFGEEPSNLFNINRTIPWLLTEKSEKDYYDAKKNLKYYWNKNQIPKLHPDFIMIAGHTTTTSALTAKAQIIVYRNFDYRDMSIPSINMLLSGQRIIIIVNDEHISELQRYYSELRTKGYDPSRLILWDNSLPRLSAPYVGDKGTYVFDFVKQ